MHKFMKLIKSINSFVSKNEEEPIEDVAEYFPGLETLPPIVEDYEKEIARLLREQRQWILDEFSNFVTKDTNQTIESFLAYLRNDLFAKDTFIEQFGAQSAVFLDLTVTELAGIMMNSIDSDVPLNVLSGRTTKWVKEWSAELAEIMQLSTHRAIERELIDVIEAGESIQEAEQRLKDLPQFDRNRARTTARTEILTASSQAHQEAFWQSPAVEGKRWKHSGSAKSEPRQTHVSMDGTVVGVDELFLVDGEFGMYPRDPMFSAYNRVNCGCAIGPVINNDIIRLSPEEKEEIRQQVLEGLSE